MRLSDFFKLPNKQVQNNTTHNVPMDAARTALINKQIRALVPGQTIQGEIMAKSGGDVQIRIAEDFMLHARLDHNIHLETGKNMIFQVMNNGSSLTLSPLFANTAADANIYKALDMGGLPVNDKTVNMTGAMMEAGLSIDKHSLQTVFREMNIFPQADMMDIIDLHRLGLPVTEENLAQIASYKNLTHQLVDGMNHIVNEIPLTMHNLLQSNNLDGAVQLFQALIGQAGQLGKMSGEGMNTAPEGTSQDAGTAQNGSPQDVGYAQNSPSQDVGATPNSLSQDGVIRQVFTEGVPQGSEKSGEKGDIPKTYIRSDVDANVKSDSAPAPSQDMGSLSGKLQGLLEQLQLPEGEHQQMADQLAGLRQGTLSSHEVLQMVHHMIHAAMKHPGKHSGHVRELLSDSALLKLTADVLKDNWTIRPEELQGKDKMNELFHRLDRELGRLSDVLDHAGQSESSMGRSVSNMTQNMNFLHQLNQMYAYVQLPLKMGQDTAHGDLYVYANKKHMASPDGTISALLHLDMPNLGALDIYVSMQNSMEGKDSRVNTRFYVQDDKILDFLSKHMDMLDSRLKARGYIMQCEMTVREPEQKGNPVNVMLQENQVGLPLVQYSFDVRA